MAASEFDLIYRYLASFGSAPHVCLGVGDDAAVLAVPDGERLVVSTDTQLEGRHFPEHSLPEHIACRAIGAAASDLAAMGAKPLGMTLALTLPEADELWLHSFSMGLANCVKTMTLPLVGGDLTRGELSLTVTVLGSAPLDQWLTRGGARAGDLLCVSGTVGDAAAGLALVEGRLSADDLLSVPQQEWLELRFYRPRPRFDMTDWLRANASAAIDISDGLLADIGHLLNASGVACQLDVDRLPLSPALQALPREQALAWALSGGDDYELAFTVASGTHLPEGVTVIGEVTAGQGLHCPGYESAAAGFDHFGG